MPLGIVIEDCDLAKSTKRMVLRMEGAATQKVCVCVCLCVCVYVGGIWAFQVRESLTARAVPVGDQQNAESVGSEWPLVGEIGAE